MASVAPVVPSEIASLSAYGKARSTVEGTPLSPEELRLLELRKEGVEWADIAQRLGGTPEALRKQLARAMSRVAHALGFAEVVHAG